MLDAPIIHSLTHEAPQDKHSFAQVLEKDPRDVIFLVLEIVQNFKLQEVLFVTLNRPSVNHGFLMNSLVPFFIYMTDEST
jgi:hypothetical protein